MGESSATDFYLVESEFINLWKRVIYDNNLSLWILGSLHIRILPNSILPVRYCDILLGLPKNRVNNSILQDKLNDGGTITHNQDFYFVPAEKLWSELTSRFNVNLALRHTKVKKDVRN